jgi:hypothetical protein
VVVVFPSRRLWNGLRQEFPELPRMSFGKSLLITAAWERSEGIGTQVRQGNQEVKEDA